MTPTPAYVGWSRRLPAGRWAAVCRAAGLWPCWERLLLVREAGDCEKVVLVEGQHPNRKKEKKISPQRTQRTQRKKEGRTF